MKIYITSSWQREEEAKVLKNILLNENHEVDTFEENKKGIEWAEVVVMIPPCGESGYLQVGYAKGLGKKNVIYCEDLSYSDDNVGFCDMLTGRADILIQYLAGLDAIKDDKKSV